MLREPSERNMTVKRTVLARETYLVGFERILENAFQLPEFPGSCFIGNTPHHPRTAGGAVDNFLKYHRNSCCLARRSLERCSNLRHRIFTLISKEGECKVPMLFRRESHKAHGIARESALYFCNLRLEVRANREREGYGDKDTPLHRTECLSIIRWIALLHND